MKVILQADVIHLGRAGDILAVRPGYARNYLFPKKLAIPARSGSLKEQTHKNKIAELKAKKNQLLRNETAKKLQGCKLCFRKTAGKEGKLFGSVTSFEISSALKESGFIVDKKFILLPAPIKNVGDYKIQIDFGQNTLSEVEVQVLSEKKASSENLTPDNTADSDSDSNPDDMTDSDESAEKTENTTSTTEEPVS